MSLNISAQVKSSLGDCSKYTEEIRKQIPFSVAEAMNATATGSRFIPNSQATSYLAAVEKASTRGLDRPKPFTTKGLFMQEKATKRKPRLLLAPKDKGGNRERYIAGNVFGNPRPVKAWEAALVRSLGDETEFQPGVKFVPTKNVKRDSRGNISLGTIRSIGKKAQEQKVFFGTPKGSNGQLRPPGIYRTYKRKNLKALFIQQDTINYSQRLDLFPLLAVTYKRQFPRNFKRALIKNVRRDRARMVIL